MKTLWFHLGTCSWMTVAIICRTYEPLNWTNFLTEKHFGNATVEMHLSNLHAINPNTIYFLHFWRCYWESWMIKMIIWIIILWVRVLGRVFGMLRSPINALTSLSASFMTAIGQNWSNIKASFDTFMDVTMDCICAARGSLRFRTKEEFPRACRLKWSQRQG
jgi:hypothetical protein